MNPLPKHDSTFDRGDHSQLGRQYIISACASPCQHGSFVEVPGEHFPPVALQSQNLNHVVVHWRSVYKSQPAPWHWPAHHESCQVGKDHGQAPLDRLERRHGHAVTDTTDSNAASQTRNGEELHYASMPRPVHRLYSLRHGHDEYVRVRHRASRKENTTDGEQGAWDIIVD